jgi:hypothetical protein
MKPAKLRQRVQIKQHINKSTEYEGLVAVTVNSIIFWDLTPCSLVEIYRRF